MQPVDENDGITPEGRRRLEGLRVTADPPDGLEQEVVAVLRRRGAFDTHLRFRWVPWFAAAAAVALAFLAGRSTGKAPGIPGRDVAPGRQYVMMMLVGPTLDASPSGDEPSRAEEAQQWADELRRSGRFVLGDEFDSRVRLITADATLTHTIETEMVGLVVVVAKDMAEAEAIARSSPFVQHGGTIAIHSGLPP